MRSSPSPLQLTISKYLPTFQHTRWPPKTKGKKKWNRPSTNSATVQDRKLSLWLNHYTEIFFIHDSMIHNQQTLESVRFPSWNRGKAEFNERVDFHDLRHINANVRSLASSVNRRHCTSAVVDILSIREPLRGAASTNCQCIRKLSAYPGHNLLAKTTFSP